jgi:hypothetical protein
MKDAINTKALDTLSEAELDRLLEILTKAGY